MFEISVKHRFTASHALKDVMGLIEKPHEHEWLCEIVLSSEDTDDAGMVADFREVDRAIGDVLSGLEGRDLHEMKEFSKSSPSAENVAFLIYDGLRDELGEKLKRVKVWEDADHSATYYE